MVRPGKAGGENNDEELDEFVTTLKTQLEIFVNRMKSNSSRGRSITNDSSVQTLFMNTMAMHSKLLKHIQDQEDKRVYYEGLQVLCHPCQIVCFAFFTRKPVSGQDCASQGRTGSPGCAA